MKGKTVYLSRIELSFLYGQTALTYQDLKKEVTDSNPKTDKEKDEFNLLYDRFIAYYKLEKKLRPPSDWITIDS